MLQQIGHRDFHHIGEGFRVQAHVQHRNGQQGHDCELSCIDVCEFFHIVVGDRAQVNALEHPQGVSSAKDQGRGGQHAHDEVKFDSAQNDHPLTHKSGCAWQTAVGHGEQQCESCKLGHGFVSAGMFLSIGVLYDRVHSREISSYGGVVNTMPKFAAFALLFAMANCGLPGTAGFVGEWMVILGAVKFDFVVGMLAASALIFGAAYTLWMFKRVYLGPVTNDDVKELTDINAREFTVMALLAIAVLYMGLYPKPFTDVMEVSVANLLEHVAASKLP